MRSISRLLVPVGVLALLAASRGEANAETPVMRGGKPWIHIGGTYVGNAPATDVVARANAIVKSRAPFAELTRTTTDHFGDGDTVVRYEQSYRGLPVIARGVSVRLSSQGQPITTMVDVEDQLPSNITPQLTSLNAATVASSHMRVHANVNEAHLIIWPTLDRGARLAYAVVPHIPAGLPMAPRIIIDAMTGELLEARDLISYAQAFTYEFNPVKTPTESNKLLALTPTGANLTNDFIESTNCLDKKTVKSLNVGIPITVHVCDLVQVATADANGDFIYQPSDVPGSPEARTDAYSEVSIYYHTAKAYTFYRTLQGDDTAQVVNDKPLRLVANLQIPQGLFAGDLTTASNPDIALDTFQNAFFSPAGQGLGQIFDELYGFNAGALWFGQGPKRDYSYDGDVIYHEFTHAVVDKTLKLAQWHLDARGAVDSSGAMNEGLADFFSSAITGDPDVGEYAAQDLGATTGSAGIRTLANQDKCPSTIVGEVHQDSTVFSGGLWEARSGLAEADRSKFDGALYKAMRTNIGRGDLGYEDLTNLFLAVLKTDLPDGATKLTAAMTGRGLLPGCERIVAFDKAPIASAVSQIGFTAPGTQSVAIQSIAPGIIQIQGKLPANATTVTVTFKAGTAAAGNPLGGQSTPFTPLVLAKFGKAITWDAKTGHDADVKVTPKDSTAVINVPAGTTADSVFVQIANTGQSDGAYDSVALAYAVGPDTGNGATTTPVADPTPAPAAAAPAADSGCGCEAVGGDEKRAFAFFPGILGLAALLLRRRRATRS